MLNNRGINCKKNFVIVLGWNLNCLKHKIKLKNEKYAQYISNFNTSNIVKISISEQINKRTELFEKFV